ncbi:hypothetical protein ABH926_005372 [Catenulispora sp. GP43]|uniref:hypothetical protein n=1 Tax=Catenulispora sp. GP43 TaxID=3156263 RepID=UPI003511D110
MINVSEAAGAVAVGTGFTPACGTNFPSSQDGSQAALLIYASFSVNFFSHLTLNLVDEKTLTSSNGSEGSGSGPAACSRDGGPRAPRGSGRRRLGLCPAGRAVRRICPREWSNGPLDTVG